MLHPRSPLRRRPSAAMVVAVVAFFPAIGGVGYAAATLAPNSVGSAQIQNGAVGNSKLASNAVGWRKIIPGTVGRVRIDPNAVQERVTGTCTNAAISAVATTGKVTCAATAPGEFDVTGTPVALTSSSTATTIASEALAGGSSYLVSATPYVQVTGTAGDQQVAVTCRLAVGPTTGAMQTRSVTVDLATTHETEATSIPLVVPAPSNSTSIVAGVTCVRSVTGGGTDPTVDVSTTINALETSSNTTATTPTTSTTTTPTTTTTTPTTTTSTTTTG
jgi:hypothetical protein